jgi:hypothetical protein
MAQDSHRAQNVFRLACWWKHWIGNWAGRAELDRPDQRSLGSRARDVGASPTEFYAVAGKWPDSADLLTRRMTALRLDPVEVARTEPLVSREMTKLCSLCGNKRQCEHDLSQAAVSPRWWRYCPNSQTLMALVAGLRTKPENSDR